MRADFNRRVQAALADPVLQGALDHNALRRRAGLEEAFAGLPERDLLEQQAREIRIRTLDRLDQYLNQFRNQLEMNGCQVHMAADAAQACEIVAAIARHANASIVAKSKSMVTEEIELNHALQSAGMAVIETDLGEFIVQLRHEKPSHIITPAVHLTRQQVAETFAAELKTDYDPDVEVLTAIARRHLRKVFLTAQVGISGVNFGVAESGSLCLVTNEGNGRMVTTIPPVHVAVMGIERLVPTLDDLAVLLELLPRYASGQAITSYVSLMQGPRRPGDPDGPAERHVILVDNGRTEIAASTLLESLYCIRCGACLNACPVFREIGGHAYGSVYPGPIGSVVSPGLFGIDEYGHLANASTLCGACQEVCPVDIDLPGLLLQVRDEVGRSGGGGSRMGRIMRAFAWGAESPARFSWAQRLGYLLGRLLPRRHGWLTNFPPGWRQHGHFPPIARRTFRRLYQTAEPEEVIHPQESKPDLETVPYRLEHADVQPLQAFQQALAAVEGEIVCCTQDEVADNIAAFVKSLGVDEVISWSDDRIPMEGLLNRLERLGVHSSIPDVVHPIRGPGESELEEVSQAKIGLTGGLAGLADSGTIVVQSGEGRSQLASLLPEIHLAVIRASDIFTDRRAWMAEQGHRLVQESAAVNLITGPSRTGDIEMTHTVGVHGPPRVLVFCLTDA